MPRLVSLLCKGCLSRGEKCSLFDDDQKRSCYGKCHHSLCLQCVSKDAEQDCPICGEPKAFEHKTIDYAASRVYEDLLNRPIDIFREWWNSETVYTGRCALCLEEGRDLRVCIGCEIKLPQFQQYVRPILPPIDPAREYLNRRRRGLRIPISVADTKYEFSVIDHSILPDVFSRVYCSDCMIDRHDEIEERNIARIKTLFDKIGKSPKAKDLEVHEPKKNEKWKLKDLKNYDKEMKRITFPIARTLLLTCLNKMKEKDFCKLRFWRLFRTAEALMSFSYSLCHSPGRTINSLSCTVEWYSELNKFFIGFENICVFPEERVGKLMKSLEVQLEEVRRIPKKCECTEIYEKMHKWKWGNAVDQIFVKMVKRFDLDDATVSGCLLRRDSRLYEELQESYKKAEEMSQWKLHMIPTAVCWRKSIYSGDLCCLFDDKNRKPYKCRGCGNSICAECRKDGMAKCPFCGLSIYDLNEVRWKRKETTVNTEIIELVDFYKKNCVDLYEKWWNSEPVPFCLPCSSYSTQLEICAFCELSEKHSL